MKELSWFCDISRTLSLCVILKGVTFIVEPLRITKRPTVREMIKNQDNSFIDVWSGTSSCQRSLESGQKTFEYIVIKSIPANLYSIQQYTRLSVVYARI